MTRLTERANEKDRVQRAPPHGSSLSFADMILRALPIAALLVAVLIATAGEKRPVSVIESPRPNSGTFSFAQAEARKSEIFSNSPSPRLHDWKNPYMGFCIHIAKDDSITVYGHSMKGLPEYSKPRAQSVADIKELMDQLPLAGNPAGVLIHFGSATKRLQGNPRTFENPFHSIRSAILRTEPDGPANRSRPVGPVTNRTPPAAGSGG
jgi:hypothetical protein